MARPRHEQPRYRLRRQRTGIWYIVWTEDGKTRRISTGENREEDAEQFLRQFEAGATSPDESTGLLGDILGRYAEARSDKASASSIRATCNILIEAFGHLRPEQVHQALVAKHAEKRLAQGRSRSTVYNDLLYLRSAVNWAIRHGIVPKETHLPFEQPVKRAPPRDRWLTKEEAQSLIEAAVTPHIRIFLVLGFMTGHRAEALLSLRWEAVDFQARRIDFGEHVGNKRRAVVPINDTLLRELREAWAIATSPWVVEYGGWRVKDVRRGFHQTCERAGVSGVTPHVMRHSCATWLAQSGVSTREASRMLGMSEAIFESTYGKHSPEYLSGAAKAVEL